MALSGFSNPLSPSGRAALVEPTPHYISSDAIRVTFRAGADVARSYLPEPLEPIEDGLGYAYVADMLKLSASEPDQPFLNPERTQYGEGIIGFYCKHGDVTGRFSAFIWVTQDWSMGFGQLMGWAKKMGEVHRTRLNAFNPGMRELGPGVRLAGVVHRYGDRLLRVGIDIERAEAANALPAFGDRGFMLRYFPSVGLHVPEVRQLVSLKLGQIRTGDVFSGAPTLEFGSSPSEELEPLKDAVPLRAYTYRQGWVTDSVVELVKDFNAEGEGAA